VTPVRIKLYGLKWVTRRSYLVRQGIVLVLGSGIIAACWWYPRPTLSSSLGIWLLGVLNLIPWLAGLLLVLYGLETVVVLRLFARKEAAPRAEPPPAGGADIPVCPPPLPSVVSPSVPTLDSGGPAPQPPPPPEKSEVS